MASVVDIFPYPWVRPEARELHFALCQLYPSAKGAIFAAQQVGIEPAFIDAGQEPFLVWKDVLELCAKALKTRALIQNVLAQNPNNPRRELFEAILREEPPVYDAEPRSELGSPSFVRGSDDITEAEALLFQDDLTLPFGRIPWLMGVLGKLKDLGAAVCRIAVARQGAMKRGTGFRIGPDLLLTNWHVLTFEGIPATSIKAEFGYEDDGQGGGLQSSAIPCDPATVRTNKDDDWGIVQVAQPLAATIPTIALSGAAIPVIDEVAFIVQHPGGERKRIAYVRNQITHVDDRVVQYVCDTKTGSSGSPVFDEAGRLIALHHAGGRPREVAGKAPLSKNEGIRISAVAAGIAAIGVAVP